MSILNQELPPNEIVVCDDCSSDNTLEVVQNVLNGWSGLAKIIQNETNLGYKKNFQKAISICSGDIIFLSDQDDVWDLQKISLCIKEFDKDPDCVMVFHDAQIVDCNLNLISSSFWKTMDFDCRNLTKEIMENTLIEYNVIQGAACAFKNIVFIEAGNFSCNAHHDEWLALVAALKGNIVAVPVQLLKYRQANNIIGANVTTFWEKIKKYNNSFKEQLNINYVIIVNRYMVLNDFYNQYNKNINDSFMSKIFNYNKFAKKRLEYMKNKNIFGILLILKSYFRYYHKKSIAFKAIIKDGLFIFFN